MILSIALDIVRRGRTVETNGGGGYAEFGRGARNTVLRFRAVIEPQVGLPALPVRRLSLNIIRAFSPHREPACDG
jgi:hypothetical protein